MNKIIYQLISVCFLFGTLASCSSEEEQGKSAPTAGITLELKTMGQTRSAVDPGTEAERQINSIAVWFFEGGAGDTEKALFYTNMNSSSTTGSLILNFTDETLRLHNMTSEGTYKIFVVANLPGDATVGGDTALGDLQGYSYTAAQRPGAPFIMTGNSVGAYDFAVNSQISIPLLRVVSRLDITVKNATGKNWLINKVSIAGDQKSVLLFTPVTGTPASDVFADAQPVLTTPTTTNEATCSGYIYENRSADAVKVVIEGSVDGTTQTWIAELNPHIGSTTISRNTICGVTLNLKEKVIVTTDIQYNITNTWTEKEMASGNGETFIELDKQVVETSSTMDGLLHIRTNAATVQVDMTGAPGFVLANSAGDKVELASVDGLVELAFREDVTAAVTPISGKVVITAGRIKKTVSLSHVETAAKFKIKSISVNGLPIEEGTILPATFNLPAGTTEASIKIVVENNILWQYKFEQYVGTERKADNLFYEISWQNVKYDGISGEHSVDVTIQANDAYLGDVITCYLEIGLYGSFAGYSIVEYQFTISKP